jgi:hypothetical protein
MTYTKAPWHICEVTGRGLQLIRDANGYCVAEAVKPANSGASYIDHIANARLIAAAPELLDIVDRYTRACRAYLPDHLQQAFCGLYTSSDEAIAKARGEAA